MYYFLNKTSRILAKIQDARLEQKFHRFDTKKSKLPHKLPLQYPRNSKPFDSINFNMFKGNLGVAAEADSWQNKNIK